jgi:micrococcal nuclease
VVHRVPARAALVAILAAALGVGWWAGGHARPPSPRLGGVVVDARDGDTIVVRLDAGTTEVVRMLGVDTPETHHPTRPVGCWGPEAAAHTRAELVGRRVVLALDAEPRDRYGRLLAHVHVGGRWFNEELVAAGFAEVLVIPPNGAGGRDLLAAEVEARAARRGLWGACPP